MPQQSLSFGRHTCPHAQARCAPATCPLHPQLLCRQPLLRPLCLPGLLLAPLRQALPQAQLQHWASYRTSMPL